MRLVLITAVLGLLVQPAFARSFDCPQIYLDAANAYENVYIAYERSVDAAQEGSKFVLKNHPGASMFDREFWPERVKNEYVLAEKQAGEEWRQVEMLANIYSAFCKD